MINVDDFTSLKRGFDVPLEGRIETCPRCGRNGIEERPECANPYFLHVQATDVQADGMRIEPLDSCPAVRELEPIQRRTTRAGG